MATSRRTYATVPQPSELRFGVVRVWWAEALGDWEILGFLLPIFTVGNAIGLLTVKCFRFVCKNLTTFPFGKRIVGKLDSWAFWQYIQFQDQRWGL